VGGSFLDVGTATSPNLALFVDPAALDVAAGAAASGRLLLSPPAENPARLESSVRRTLARRAILTVSLVDPSGRRVRALVDRVELDAGSYARTLDTRALAPGL
jgi:hypothetical protein